MFEGANPLIFDLAKDLRKNMTQAELILWGYLKAGLNGLKFRRQHPLGIYVVDFYCHKLKLVIEIDGSIHNQLDIIESDKIRQQDLEKWGYSVVGFTNDEVVKSADNVLRTIQEFSEKIKVT